MLMVEFTPGPNNPKDLDSFLWPLVEEFMELEKGVSTWNAASEGYSIHLLPRTCRAREADETERYARFPVCAVPHVRPHGVPHACTRALT